MNQPKNTTHRGWLLSGAGNTFAVELTDNKIDSERAQAICSNFKVDGYLGLSQISPESFEWNFFNSDGSDAEFCGNAARCAQEFVSKNLNSLKSNHKTIAGPVFSWTEKNENWVQMPLPEVIKAKMTVDLDGQKWTGFFCNTGVPHFVLVRTQLRHDTWIDVSRKLRNHPDFGARGSNITWVKPEISYMMAVTYERGVEDFTQACGTGAMAAALSWKQSSNQKIDFEIRMPGGNLQIRNENSQWVMTGPVEKIGEWST